MHREISYFCYKETVAGPITNQFSSKTVSYSERWFQAVQDKCTWNFSHPVRTKEMQKG